MRAILRAMPVAGLLWWGTPSVGSAQAKGVELSGFAGGHFPTDKDGLEGTRVARRRGSLAYGGRLTYWTSPKVGLELAGTFSPARITVTTSLGSRFARSTNVFAGAGKVMLNLMPTSNPLAIFIGGGLAVVHTGSPIGVPGTDARNDIGGVGDIGLRFKLGENVFLRGDAEGYFYNTNFGLADDTFAKDFVLSGGLSLHF